MFNEAIIKDLSFRDFNGTLPPTELSGARNIILFSTCVLADGIGDFSHLYDLLKDITIRRPALNKNIHVLLNVAQSADRGKRIEKMHERLTELGIDRSKIHLFTGGERKEMLFLSNVVINFNVAHPINYRSTFCTASGNFHDTQLLAKHVPTVHVYEHGLARNPAEANFSPFSDASFQTPAHTPNGPQFYGMKMPPTVSDDQRPALLASIEPDATDFIRSLLQLPPNTLTSEEQARNYLKEHRFSQAYLKNKEANTRFVVSQLCRYKGEKTSYDFHLVDETNQWVDKDEIISKLRALGYAKKDIIFIDKNNYQEYLNGAWGKAHRIRIFTQHISSEAFDKLCAVTQDGAGVCGDSSFEHAVANGHLPFVYVPKYRIWRIKRKEWGFEHLLAGRPHLKNYFDAIFDENLKDYLQVFRDLWDHQKKEIEEEWKSCYETIIKDERYNFYNIWPTIFDASVRLGMGLATQAPDPEVSKIAAKAAPICALVEASALTAEEVKRMGYREFAIISNPYYYQELLVGRMKLQELTDFDFFELERFQHGQTFLGMLREKGSGYLKAIAENPERLRAFNHLSALNIPAHLTNRMLELPPPFASAYAFSVTNSKRLIVYLTEGFITLSKIGSLTPGSLDYLLLDDVYEALKKGVQTAGDSSRPFSQKAGPSLRAKQALAATSSHRLESLLLDDVSEALKKCAQTARAKQALVAQALAAPDLRLVIENGLLPLLEESIASTPFYKKIDVNDTWFYPVHFIAKAGSFPFSDILNMPNLEGSTLEKLQKIIELEDAARKTPLEYYLEQERVPKVVTLVSLLTIFDKSDYIIPVQLCKTLVDNMKKRLASASSVNDRSALGVLLELLQRSYIRSIIRSPFDEATTPGAIESVFANNRELLRPLMNTSISFNYDIASPFYLACQYENVKAALLILQQKGFETMDFCIGAYNKKGNSNALFLLCDNKKLSISMQDRRELFNAYQRLMPEGITIALLQENLAPFPVREGPTLGEVFMQSFHTSLTDFLTTPPAPGLPLYRRV